MTVRFLASRFVTALALLVTAVSIHSQNPGTGSYPYARSDSFGFDSINPGNLNVHFAIPVVSKTGRGGLDFQYALVFDSLIWTPVTSGSSQVWTPDASWGLHGYLLNEGFKGYLSYQTWGRKCFDGGSWYWGTVYAGFTYHDEFGAQHAFNYRIDQCGNVTGDGSSSDGSGFSMDSGFTVHSASGLALSLPTQVNGTNSTLNATIKDSNGNEITNNQNGTFTDTMGGTPLTIGGSGTPSSPRTFTYHTTSGTAKVTINYTAQTVHTAFACSGVTEYSQTANLPTSIVLGDNSSTYTISYDASGRISSVTLPTGGKINYSYTGSNNGINCNDGTTIGLNRWTSISSDGTTSYARSGVTTTNGHTEITGAHNDQTEIDYVFASGVPYETTRSVYSGSHTGTLLAKTDTCYNSITPPSCTAQSLTLPISKISIYRTIGSFENGSDTQYNAYGLPTDVKEYDYGSGARGALLRETKYTYATLGNYITDKVSWIQQYDGGGNLFSQNNYVYDNPAATSTSGLPQHVSVSGPRGNLTVEYDYISGSTYFTTQFQVDDAGQLLSTWGTNPGTTLFGYDSTDTLLNSVTPPQPNGVSLNSQLGYDSNTGLLTSSTDPNSQSTNFKYDSLLRTSEIDYPDQGKTTYGYSSTQTSIYTYQNSTTHGDTEILYDGMGRQSRVQVANGQNTNPWYQADFSYNPLGMTAFASYPYQGTGSGGDTMTYDPLGRVTSVVHGDNSSITHQFAGRATQVTNENGVSRISQVDGLGRVTAVCEISSNNSMPGSGSSANCGLDLPGNGFLTTYAYDLQHQKITVTQGVQSRVFQTDWLGRTILIQEPESGQSTYSYSYNGTGLVVTRIRPKANQSSSGVTTTTTTQYDSLGRAVSVTYNDGTPTKTFQYDVSNPWGTTVQNPKGRLVLQGIANAQSIYSYDPMGRIAFVGECTPSKCGSSNFSISYNYDEQGNPLSGGDGFANYTYTYSPANELLSITSSFNDSQHPPNLVSNVANGPFGPLSWNLGNGLTGVRQYDGLGRVSGGWVCSGPSQAYCSGGSQLYGFTASWIGSALSGACDTSLNQCNSYGYDEFERLATLSVNSGPAGSYTYSYDRWGNRWTQTETNGSGGPQPNYSFNTSTNQIQQGTCSIPPNWNQICYDAAGNLVADGAHTYTYDAEGNITQVDTGTTATYTYDGLNRRARIDFGSSAAEEFLFDSAGRHSSSWDPNNHWEVNGWAYWGGFPAAFYGNGTTEFEHQDWLGSERARTSVSGQISGTYASLPFGDGFSVSGNDLVPNHFAGLDHDNAGNSDTHHAQFRQYNSTQGHWMAPDPYAGSYDFTNPQSFNRYAYVTNNPMAFGDPSGLDECDDCDCDPFWQDCFSFGGGWGTGGGGAPPKIIGYKNLDPNQIMTESLGLPPGMLIPSGDLLDIFGIGAGTTCEFGACGPGATGFMGDELHHIFPQQWVEWFDEHGVDISKYLIPLTKAAHRLKPNGLHTKLGGDWNNAWKQWMDENLNATPQEIINQAKKMLLRFGISAGDTFSDFIFIVDPCLTNRNWLYQQTMCQNGGGGA